MGLLLLAVFIGVPLVEILLFIKVGGAIGMTMTVVVVIATALIGSALLRVQGLATLREAQSGLQRAELPMDPVIHGIFLLLAGAFLLTPGFLTDAIGFALFVPPLRLALGRAIMAKAQRPNGSSMHVHVDAGSWQQNSDPSGNGNGVVIDAEASEVDETPKP